MGCDYGSILVDMHTGLPVDLLPDRLADTFAAWLREHPGAEVICRDRASGYAEGGRTGAPDAIQVADRLHLLQNLTKAVDRVVRAHGKCLKDRPESEAVAQPQPPADAPEGRRVEVTRQRHAEIHALHVKGIGNTAISRALNLDHKTVLRYLRARSGTITEPSSLLRTGPPACPASVLDPSRCRRLGHSLTPAPTAGRIRARLLLFHAEAADQAHVVYMPDTTWPEDGTPSRLVPGSI